MMLEVEELFMCCPCNVKKERNFVIAFFTTHVTSEWIAISMIAHVHSIHDTIFKCDLAVRAVIEPIIVSNRK